MDQTFCSKIFVLIVALSISMVACDANIETRASASPSARKPPFNGSIFGKRSSYNPIDERAQYGREDMIPNPSLDSNGHAPVISLALLIKQHGALVRAAVNQCLALQRDSESDQFMSFLCGELLGNKPDGLVVNPMPERWLGHLASLGRFV